MQIGQVPIMFTPEAPADVTQAIAMETQTADIAIPSLAPFMPEAPAVASHAPTIPAWTWIVVGLGVLWLMRKR